MTSNPTRLPPELTTRPITRMDVWRLSGRRLLPIDCAGLVVERDGVLMGAFMVAPGHGGVWWVGAHFTDEARKLYRFTIHRFGMAWLAGLKARGMVLRADCDERVAAARRWLERFGFERRETPEGREFYEWV